MGKPKDENRKATALRTIGWVLIVLAIGAASQGAAARGAAVDAGSREAELVVFTYFGMIVAGIVMVSKARRLRGARRPRNHTRSR